MRKAKRQQTRGRPRKTAVVEMGRPRDGEPYHHRAAVVGGSETNNWRASSAHSYTDGRKREVFIWLHAKTFNGSMCVRVDVPATLRAQRAGAAERSRPR